MKIFSAIKELIVKNNASIYEAMKKINKNHLRIVFIIDENKKIVGLVTDGDLRRQLVSGARLEDKIAYNKNFYFINHDDGFDKLCCIFKEPGIDTVPILKEKKIFNYITKQQFQSMLLQGEEYRSDRDFSTFNSFSFEKEIFNKPWGFYKSFWLNPDSQAKILSINPDEELSLQKHFRREEHWLVIKGFGYAIVENEKIELYPGKYIFVAKGSKHKIINNSKSRLFISEVQLGDYFGEDDIKRYSDKYERGNDDI